MKNTFTKIFRNLLILLLFTFSVTSMACKNPLNVSSETSALKLCDNNNDLVADEPLKKDILNLKSLNLAFATIEDASFYEQVYGEFIAHLKICMKMPILVYPVYQEQSVIDAMKSSKVHIASFGAGATMMAVNQAGAIPFASRGSNSESEYYQLWLITKRNSPYKKITDLKNTKIAHATPSSVSGNLAPRALFPELGLKPDIDYKVEFSGRHDKSILGVKNGFYEAAAVASDVFKRMVISKEINQDDFNIIWKSSNFPTNSFSYSYNLAPNIKKNLQNCFYKYRFNEKNKNLLGGNDEFVPVSYIKDWDIVRKVAKKANKK